MIRTINVMRALVASVLNVSTIAMTVPVAGVWACVTLAPPPGDRDAQTDDDRDANESAVVEPSILIEQDLVVRLVCDRLTAEAQSFRADRMLRRDGPTFARVFEHRLDPARALDMIHETQDDTDVVVDAYVRWQLLGFLSDDSIFEVERLGPTLPPYVPNPASSRACVTGFERADRQSHHSASQRREIFARWDALRHETRVAELLNVPTRALRSAIYDGLPEVGPDRIRFMLFELEDTIEAGWDTRSIKTRLGRELRDRKLDDSISMDQRWTLVRIVESLEGMETRMVRDVETEGDDHQSGVDGAERAVEIDIGFGAAAVRSTDVEKWVAYLLRHDPPS